MIDAMIKAKAETKVSGFPNVKTNGIGNTITDTA